MDTASEFNKSLGDKYQPEKPNEYQLQHTGYDQQPPTGYDAGQAGYNQPPPPDYDARQAGYNQPPPTGFDAGQAGYNQPPPPGYDARHAGYNQPPPTGFDPRQSAIVMAQPTSGMCVVPVVRPPDYLCVSIVAIFFCWPMAICAIFASRNSTDAFNVGDVEKAKKEGRSALQIAVAAIVLGIVITAVVVAVNVLSLGKHDG